MATVIDSAQQITYPLAMSKTPKIFSMTGFSRSVGGYGKYNWNWEAKSVNGKGLDIRCRLPQGLDEFDLKARKMAGNLFSRGNIGLHLSIKENGSPSRYRVNRELLDELVKTAKELFKDKDGFEALRLDGLLAVRGVIELVEEEANEREIQERNELIMVDLEKALTELSLARQAEGARIARVLKTQLAEIGALSQRAKSIANSQPVAIRERLSQQLEELQDANPTLPEERIAQEVALLITKTDVREELDRLEAHLQAAHQLFDEGGVIGRKFDFLCQEFNREANTICSKAHILELSNVGLELKAVIEQFREQVQNIE